jgi:hypothetical protein
MHEQNSYQKVPEPKIGQNWSELSRKTYLVALPQSKNCLQGANGSPVVTGAGLIILGRAAASLNRRAYRRRLLTLTLPLEFDLLCRSCPPDMIIS